MTTKGKIFRALFFIIAGTIFGFYIGFKTFDQPQTVNKVEIGKVKSNDGGKVDLQVNNEAETQANKTNTKQKKRLRCRNRNK